MSEVIKLPWGIDIHVHFREPGFTYKETMATGMTAARAGGIRYAFDMPNTNPVTDTIQSYRSKKELASQVDGVFLIGGFTNSNVSSKQIRDLAMEARLLKVFLADSTGNLGISQQNFIEGLNLIEGLDVLIMIHAEDPSLLKSRAGISENQARPEKAEINAIKNLIPILQEYSQVKFHITHVSSPYSAKILLNNGISFDVTPKHLFLNANLVQELGNFAIMNPPLRPKSSQEQLLELLLTEKIPMVSSDHAPHTREDKKAIVAGAPGVQELYPCLIDLYARGIISKRYLEDLIFNNPRTLMNKVGFELERGEILVDLHDVTIFSKNNIKSKAGWSLWENKELKGKIVGFEKN